MPTTQITDTIAKMDARTKLMLIAQIADTLDDDLNDALHDGLAAAFEQAEQGFSGVFTPFYPAGVTSLTAWAEWRAERDRAVAAWFARFGSVAA